MKTVIVSLELENRVNGIGKQWQCGKIYVVCMKEGIWGWDRSQAGTYLCKWELQHKRDMRLVSYMLALDLTNKLEDEIDMVKAIDTL